MSEHRFTSYPVTLGYGSANAPSLTFDDAGTGFYRNAKNQVSLAVGGVQSLLFGQGFVVALRYADVPAYRMYRAQGTAGTPTATSDGANLGDVSAYGYTGSAFASAATVRFAQDGAVSGANVPGKVSLYARNGSGTLTEGLVVRSTGDTELKKSVTLGSAATDVITCTGRFKPRKITSTTSQPGVEGEVVYCTGDKKSYTCTASSETAATWAAHY